MSKFDLTDIEHFREQHRQEQKREEKKLQKAAKQAEVRGAAGGAGTTAPPSGSGPPSASICSLEDTESNGSTSLSPACCCCGGSRFKSVRRFFRMGASNSGHNDQVKLGCCTTKKATIYRFVGLCLVAVVLLVSVYAAKLSGNGHHADEQ